MPSGVLQTTRPIDEGLDYGEVKRRLRKCRECATNFTTFEIHESLFRSFSLTEQRLTRQPLQMESEDRRVSLKPKDPKK